MLIVDGHLDLAYNALRGRDGLRPARQQRGDADGAPSVGLPDLRAGGVDLICATVFCAPDSPKERGYRTPDEAHAAALEQLHWYRQQANNGQIRIIKDQSQLPVAVDRQVLDAPRPIDSVLLLEGADPIRSPDDLPAFFDAGVRIVGLAWKQTRYAGGTGAPGPLTPDGARLVRELDRFRVIHDTSHLAEESFFQLLDLNPRRVIASHSNCQSIVPTDRQLSDEMIRAIAYRGGIIGINLYDRFLLPPPEQGKRRATLADVVRHVRHMCDVVGSADHVGLGTDMDGGFGRENIPVEIESSADLPRIGEALHAAGFDDTVVRGVLGRNWLRFFAGALPEQSPADGTFA